MFCYQTAVIVPVLNVDDDCPILRLESPKNQFLRRTSRFGHADQNTYCWLVSPAPERRLGRIPTAMPQGLRDELDPAARDQSVLFVPKH